MEQLNSKSPFRCLGQEYRNDSWRNRGNPRKTIQGHVDEDSQNYQNGTSDINRHDDP